MKKQLKLIHPITILIIIGLLSCKSSPNTEPDYNPNNCTAYACPTHQDKIFVAPEKCPECGLKMIYKGSIDSLLKTIKQSPLDSLDFYHNLIMKQSDKIMMNDTLSKEEQLQYLMDATKNLNKAKTINENINLLANEKRKLILKPHYKKLTLLYAVASYRITSINSELARKHYNKDIVKLYAKELKETVYEVDKEQRIIRVK